MNPTFSPLRYPGGKSQFYDSLLRILDANELFNITYCEPFAGGAGVAIRLLLEGRASRIIINDADRAVYSFWYETVFDTDWFVAQIMSLPINMETWHQLRETLRNPNSSQRELGLATLFLNRTNRSGILKAGPIGGMKQEGAYKLDCRFNRDVIVQKIRKISMFRNRIVLENLDAEALIRKHAKDDEVFWFIDPPYYKKGSDLYQNYYTHDSHVSLARTIDSLLAESKWILTYDNCPEILDIYSGRHYLIYGINYSAQVKRIEKELLFWNRLFINDRMVCTS